MPVLFVMPGETVVGDVGILTVELLLVALAPTAVLPTPTTVELLGATLVSLAAPNGVHTGLSLLESFRHSYHWKLLFVGHRNFVPFFHRVSRGRIQRLARQSPH